MNTAADLGFVTYATCLSAGGTRFFFGVLWAGVSFSVADLHDIAFPRAVPASCSCLGFGVFGTGGLCSVTGFWHVAKPLGFTA